MIEMLGVLAIIGVLSVSGIAGYSKAMERFKFIKYQNGLVELFSNFIHIKDELKFDRGENTWTRNYPEIMQAMGLIPDEFEVPKSTLLKDKFGHEMNIFHDGRPNENHFNFNFRFQNTRISSLACHTLLETTIQFRNDVWQIYRQPLGVPDSADAIPYYIAYGSHFCTKFVKCLSNLTMNDIQEICYYYKGKPETYVYAIQVVFKQ